MIAPLLRALLPAGNAPDQDIREISVALLGDNGPLSDILAPVAIVAADGTVLSANGAADQLAPILGPRGPLAAKLNRVQHSDGLVVETVASGDDDLPGVWELTLIPLAAGEATIIVGRDISHEQALRNALVDSRRRYKDLVEISSDFAWETDAEGCFVFVSPARALGRDSRSYIGRRPQEFLAEGLDVEAADLFSTRTPLSEVDLWMTRADGRNALILASAIPVKDSRGRWSGARGICRDITALHERDVALAFAETRERLIAYILRTMRDEIDPRSMLTAAATAVAKALGCAGCRIYHIDNSGQLDVAADFGKFPASDKAAYRLLAKAARKDGCITDSDGANHLMCTGTTYRRNLNGAVLVARGAEPGPWGEDDRVLFNDVAVQLALAIEQFEYHNRLEALSRTDELTGLLNRRAFFSELESRIARIRAGGRTGTLFFVDLDNFKAVNDVHGHKRGDDALLAVASMLTAGTRPGDLVARLGGDEFALWLDRTGPEAAAARAKDLLKATRPLKNFSGHPEMPLGISIGVASLEPGAGESISDLIARADEAMYRIKHNSKGGFRIADARSDANAARKELAKP